MELLQSLTPGVRKMRGVFETLRVSGGAQYLPAHYARLCRGLKMLDLPVPWTRRALRGAIKHLLQAVPKAGRLRIMVWRQGGGVWWALVPGEYGPLSRTAQVRGVTVAVIEVRKKFRKEDGWFKSLDYSVYAQALKDARAQGCFEALLATADGRIIDGSRTGLILLTENALLVPPPGFGTVDSLLSRRIIALARDSGLPVRRRTIFINDLARARAAWLANSLIGLLPIRLRPGSGVLLRRSQTAECKAESYP
ncbi:MAG: aminotransferase class IV [Candidatus Omnitrophica bacterium]|nr:aminotransferase class IV [Candidatus Omnitrophota bacterium]